MFRGMLGVGTVITHFVLRIGVHMLCAILRVCQVSPWKRLEHLAVVRNSQVQLLVDDDLCWGLPSRLTPGEVLWA